MKPHRFALTLHFVLALAPLAGCASDEGGDIDTQVPVAEQPASLTISGDVEVRQYESAPISVNAEFASGENRDVTREGALKWIVEDPDIAVVGADGLVKGIHPGATRVQASYGEAMSEPRTLSVR